MVYSKGNRNKIIAENINMKIKILTPKKWSEQRLTEGEEKLIKLLEFDDMLEEYLRILRKPLNIPKEGYDWNKKRDVKLLSKNDQEFMKLLESGKGFLWCYNLPPKWIITAITLILFNAAVAPDETLIPAVTLSVNRHTFNISNYPTLTISIRENIKLDEFVKMLWKRKEEYDKLISFIPSNPKGTLIKRRNLELAHMIKNVTNKSQKMTDEDISRKIEDKYGFSRSADSFKIAKIRNKVNAYYRKYILSDKMR